MAIEVNRKVAEDLRKASDGSPVDAKLSLQAALALDKVSREATAIRYYERALKLGLESDDSYLATVCLVSSLRNVHRYEDALEAVQIGKERFPNSVVLSIFGALIRLDNGEPNMAVYELGMLVLTLTLDDMGEGYATIIRSKLRGIKMRRP